MRIMPRAHINALWFKALSQKCFFNDPAMSLRMNNLERGRKAFRRLKEFACRMQQLTSICQIYADVGLSAIQNGDLRTAETMFEAGVKEVDRQKLRCSAALALMRNLALTYYRQRRLNDAASILDRALKLCKQHPDPSVKPEVALALADIHFELGNREQAEDLYRKHLHKSGQKAEVLRPRFKRYAFLLSESGKPDLARQTLQALQAG